METARGLQIVLDGPDGGGKSTIAKQLVEWLQSKADTPAIYTRHPGATPIGRELRKLIADSEMHVDPQTRALLFAADNAAYISSVLKPTLAQGTWVVADRNNFISSMAYQLADGCSLEQLDKVHAATYPLLDVPQIDLLLILRVDFETAMNRRSERSANEKSETFEKLMSKRDFFERVARAYDALMDEHVDRLLKFVRPTCCEIAPEGTPRCLYIDATKPLDVVFGHVEEAVKSLMHERVAES